MLLIKLKKQDFELLASDLSQKCFTPLIHLYKMGVSNETNTTQFKEQFYEQLSPGQRALFMFYAYFNHANQSRLEFYWWSAYYYAQPKSWLALKASAKYFEDESMLALLKKMEEILQQYNYPNTLENFSVTREDLDKNIDLQAAIVPLHTIFAQITPLTVKKINNHIEKNIQDFIEMID